VEAHLTLIEWLVHALCPPSARALAIAFSLASLMPMSRPNVKF
jgi:hypothetical protein